MWVFTTAGFVSAVEDSLDSSRVMIRSRDRESLETLAAGVELVYGEPDLADEIIVYGGTDYKYRVSVSKEDFAAFMSQEITEYISYNNFKNALVSARGAQWGKAAMEVWTAMWKIEDDL